MMKAAAVARLVVLVATAVAGTAATARARSALDRDLEGYAVAACLARQREPLLKDHGDA